MTAYRATFSDGKEISLKNSTREYAFAWRFIGESAYDGSRIERTGFARDEELARKAAASESAFLTRKPRGRYGAAWKDWKPGKLISVEVVPAEKIS